MSLISRTSVRIAGQLVMGSLASVQAPSVDQVDGAAAGVWSGTLVVATMLDAMANIVAWHVGISQRKPPMPRKMVTVRPFRIRSR